MDILEGIMKLQGIDKFVKESNAIEGISRKPTDGELDEMHRFLQLDAITLTDLERFVSVYESGAKLRSKDGVNVMVGAYLPPLGGPSIPYRLLEILDNIEETDESAYETHLEYESLHPFTDGNGRSGRAIWLWQMTKYYGRLPELPFLQTFYYQSLSFSNR